MSDIRKLIDILNENTVAGSIAGNGTGFASGGIGEKPQKRVKESEEDKDKSDGKYANSVKTSVVAKEEVKGPDKVSETDSGSTSPEKSPEVIEYGFWANSAKETQRAAKGKRKSEASGKSVYGDKHTVPTHTVAKTDTDKQRKGVSESVSEGKTVRATPSKPRNFVAKHAQRSGAGSHSSKGYKRHDKHKSKLGEDELQEQDLIINPAAIKRISGFVPHDQNRTDHEVAMARSDLIAAVRNAKTIFAHISQRSEEQGIEGWVQEKLIKAADYLNAVREYMDEQHAGNAMNMGELDEGAMPNLRKHGKTVSSKDEALAALGDGHRVFAFHEMDEQPIEIKNADMIERYAPDQLLIYRGVIGEGKPGLWDNIRKRQASGKPARKPGSKGAPDAKTWKAVKALDEAEGQNINEAYIKSVNDAVDVLANLRKIAKHIEIGTPYNGNLANEYVNDVWDVYSWLENRANVYDPKLKAILKDVFDLRAQAKELETGTNSGQNRQFANQIVNTLYPLMQWIEMNVSDKQGVAEDSHSAGDTVRVPHNGKMVSGKIVRYDSGDKHGTPFYVVDIGEYESKKVPAHQVKKNSVEEGVCSECGGPSYSDEMIAEERDACYHKVKSRYKVWPSAYASGALVKCRKVGASNWGNKGKK